MLEGLRPRSPFRVRITGGRARRTADRISLSPRSPAMVVTKIFSALSWWVLVVAVIVPGNIFGEVEM